MAQGNDSFTAAVQVSDIERRYRLAQRILRETGDPYLAADNAFALVFPYLGELDVYGRYERLIALIDNAERLNVTSPAMDEFFAQHRPDRSLRPLLYPKARRVGSSTDGADRMQLAGILNVLGGVDERLAEWDRHARWKDDVFTMPQHPQTERETAHAEKRAKELSDLKASLKSALKAEMAYAVFRKESQRMGDHTIGLLQQADVTLTGAPAIRREMSDLVKDLALIGFWSNFNGQEEPGAVKNAIANATRSRQADLQARAGGPEVARKL